MEFLLVALGLLVLVAAYFCLGIFIKFMLEWWILALGVPLLLVVALTLGWVGAAIAVIGFVILLNLNSWWQGTGIYLAIERKVDGAFYLSDT